MADGQEAAGMRWLKDFLRLRRRSGRVKLALLLYLAAAGFAGDVLAGLSEYNIRIRQSVEYILEAGGENGVLEAKLQELRTISGVVDVSRQREFTLTCGEKTLTVTELTGEYLTSCYGIKDMGFERQYWLSSEAFAELFGKEEPTQRMSYEVEERTESGVFVLTDSRLEKVKAVAKGSSASLGGSNTLRVRLENRDLSGVSAEHMESLGFTIANREEMLTQSFETELMTTRLCYGMIACGLAVLAGYNLYLLGKMDQERQ